MNNNKDRIWVNQEQMLEIHSLYHLEPVLRIARSLIHNTLFSAGMPPTSLSISLIVIGSPLHRMY